MPLALRHNGQYTLTACETIEKTAQLVYRESDVKNNNRLMIRTALRRETDARSAAGTICDSNENDGVAKVLAEYLV